MSEIIESIEREIKSVQKQISRNYTEIEIHEAKIKCLSENLQVLFTLKDKVVSE